MTEIEQQVRCMHYDKLTDVGDMQDVVNILEKGEVKVDLTDIYGNSLLHWASYRGNLDLVVYLLKLGAQPEMHNNRDGHTPLHWAALQGELACVHALVEHGAKVDSLDHNGHTPLFFSCDNGKALVTHYLLQSGANPTPRDTKNRTPLHMATAKGFTTITSILLGSGAEVNAQDDAGNTALHLAAKADHCDVFEDLIRDYGASTDLRDNNGETAKDLVTYEKKHIMNLMHNMKGRLVYAPKQVAYSQPRVIQMLLFSWLSYLSALYVMDYDLGFIAGWVYMIAVFSLYARFSGLWPMDDEPNYYFITVSVVIYFSIVYCYWIYVYPVISASSGYVLAALVTQVSLFCVYWYLVVVARDPGIVPIDPAADFQGFKREIKKDTKGLNLCAGCCIRRPIRSKHVRQIGVCVAKFDHWCDWIANAVGEKNHKPFCLYVLCVDLFCLVYILSAWSVFPVSNEELWYHRLYEIIQFNRLVTLTFGFGCLFLFVMGLQLIQQIQFIFVNMTVNETMNAARYVHFWDGKEFKNPFHRGTFLQNARDWWSPSSNWYTTYRVEQLGQLGNSSSAVNEKMEV